ncbi:MAG: four helix bundle protein [Phycisphaerae bacterium]|nr:four helix bundle protein [Phycisphaerae bacterium]
MEEGRVERGKIRRFEDLEVWQAARELAKVVYGLTRKGPFSSDFGLRDQVQRAATSAMSNIAEGFERASNKEFAKYMFIAKGSIGEVRSLLYVALDQGYIDETQFKGLHDSCVRISQLCWGLIRHLQKHSGWKTGLAITVLICSHGLLRLFSASRALTT